MELLGEMIRDNEKAEEIMRLFSPLFERKRAALVLIPSLHVCMYQTFYSYISPGCYGLQHNR